MSCKQMGKVSMAWKKYLRQKTIFLGLFDKIVAKEMPVLLNSWCENAQNSPFLFGYLRMKILTSDIGHSIQISLYPLYTSVQSGLTLSQTPALSFFVSW